MAQPVYLLLLFSVAQLSKCRPLPSVSLGLSLTLQQCPILSVMLRNSVLSRQDPCFQRNCHRQVAFSNS